MRARNLKPKIFKNELLAVADPLYTVIFEGLWCAADREGRLEDRPFQLHLEINPGRDFAGTERALQWLHENKFIQRYEVDGGKYIHVSMFWKHQKPHYNEKPSTLPPPPVATKVASSPDTYAGSVAAKVASADDQGTARLSLNPDSLNPDSLNPDSLATSRASDRSNGQRLAPEAALAIPLREAGVKVSSMHPVLCEWVRDGFTVEQAMRAVAVARESKPSGDIPAKYLDAILRDSQQCRRSNGSRHGAQLTKFDRMFGHDDEDDDHVPA